MAPIISSHIRQYTAVVNTNGPGIANHDDELVFHVAFRLVVMKFSEST
jgi:hypothetical protein